MAPDWASNDGELYTTERARPARHGRAKMESMGELGWDWHVWNAPGQGQPRYGLVGKLEGAKREAGRALEALVRQSSQVA